MDGSNKVECVVVSFAASVANPYGPRINPSGHLLSEVTPRTSMLDHKVHKKYNGSQGGVGNIFYDGDILYCMVVCIHNFALFLFTNTFVCCTCSTLFLQPRTTNHFAR